MTAIRFKLPEAEFSIIYRYLDGVSQAIAKRFESGSSPNEENLTFLLCELLDEGITGLHMLEYPLCKAKEDLEKADGGITFDVSFQTHEHSKHTEHHFSGSDLGIIFVIDHPYFGHSERAILLQAKRLFPVSPQKFTLNSPFNSFHSPQRDMLQEIEKRFSAYNSIFYLWYAPSSNAFTSDDAKIIRAIEATTTSWNWHDLKGWDPFLDDMLEFGWPWFERPWTNNPPSSEVNERQHSWRIAQPGTRVSSLEVVKELTNNHAPKLIELYNAKTKLRKRRRRWWFTFEPFAELFLFGLLSDRIGDSSKDWLRLARGEKVPMPLPKNQNNDEKHDFDLPEYVPQPRHSLTFTLRSSLKWPQDIPRPE